MFTPIKYALFIALFSALIMIPLPLGIFIHDVLQNPECLKFEVIEWEYVNDEMIRANIKIAYCSNIPLRDVSVSIGEREVYIGDLFRGEFTKEVLVGRTDFEAGLKTMRFSVAGLYRLVIRIGG